MSIVQSLNKDFESRVRLGIMSVLIVNDWTEFNELKEHLKVTDGNLASHISALEKKKYIKVKKEFVARKPKTSYAVSAVGRRAFEEHINALEKLINNK